MQGRTLVGRERELREIDEMLRGVALGEPTVLLLTGEPGIGKTRLLQELAARVHSSSGTVAWGHMWEVGLTPPFWPWIQALTTLGGANRLAPDLGQLEKISDSTARIARFAEVGAFIMRCARAAPIALLFDDVHAADSSSLQLLEYLLPQFTGQPMVVALAARDRDAAPEVANALGRIQRHARRMPLSRLARADVAQLVGVEADVERVFALSEGNPLFVQELLASNASRGKLGLPHLSSARAVIRERVARLPEATRHILSAAAIVGRAFDAPVIARMLAIDDLSSALEPALAIGFVVMSAQGRYEFSHALIAEALSDELTTSERTQLHLRAAEAIEQREAWNLGSIAHHLLSAGNLASLLAVSAAERAARECMAQLAFEDAAVLLERGLQALALGAPADRRRQARLMCARAEALQHAGQHTLAVELCDKAAAIARTLLVTPADTSAEDSREPTSDAELFAHIALARGLEFRFGLTDSLLVSMLEEALQRLQGGSESLRAQLLARLAAAEQPATNPDGPVARALEAIELAAGLESRDRLRVTYVATAALVDYIEPERLEGIHRLVLEMARGTDRWIYVHTQLRLCYTLLERLDRKAFDAAVEAFSAEAQSLGIPQWIAQSHMLEAMTALFEGRLQAAEHAAAAAEAVSNKAGDASASWRLDVHHALAAWVRCEPIDAAVRERIDGYVPGRAAIAAWLATQDGAAERVRAALAELGGRIPIDPDLSAMVGNAIAFAGTTEQAATAYDFLAKRTGRIVVTGMVGSVVMDLFDRVLLLLAVAAGKWEVIDVHAERGLATASRIGSRLWCARLRADWAHALRQRRRAGDTEKARFLHRQAFTEARALVMPGLVARLESLEAKGDHSQTTVTHAAEHEPGLQRPTSIAERITFACQGEVWTVCGFGERIFVKNSRGIQMIARLIEEPRLAFHVLDLVGAEGADSGDGGPVLDPQARARYRARLRELNAERDQAEAFGDRGGVERAQAEIEMLTSELERAFGLGGRERRVAAASERARSNVQRRITHGLDQIRAASSRIGEHLLATIRTGTYCVYDPG